MSEKQPSSSTHLPDPALWVDQHGNCLYRYALVRLGNPEVAEDLVQETFLAALHARERFAGGSSERTWLVGILKHKIVDYLRRKGRERPISDLNSSEDAVEELFDKSGGWHVKPSKWAGDPGEALERKDFWETFYRCLSSLPQRLAEAFSLRELDELSRDEVCKVLSISATNLGVMLHRARLRLWRCLDIHWFHNKAERD